MSGGLSRSHRVARGLAFAVVSGAFAAGAFACGGGAFTAAPDDAGAAGPGASMTESGAGDARPPADAAGAADASAGFCATQGTAHTFCEDFLHGVPDKLVGLSANATLTADTTDFVSAPQSMESITPALPAKGDGATALATHAFPAAIGTSFTLATYFKIAGACFPSNANADPVSIAALQFPDDDYEIAIGVTASGVELIEVTTDADGGVANTQSQTFGAAGLLDSWQLWTLTLGGGIPKSVGLTVGSTSVIPERAGSTSTVLKLAPAGLLQHPTVFLGALIANVQGLSPGCKVHVDDLLFDVRAAATPAN